MSVYIVVLNDRTIRRYERKRPAIEFLHVSDLLGAMPSDCFQFAAQFDSDAEAWAELTSFVAVDPNARGEVWRIDKLIQA